MQAGIVSVEKPFFFC